MNEFLYCVNEDDAGVRIDKFLTDKNTEITRNALHKLVETGNVLVNGEIKSKNYKIKFEDMIVLKIPQPHILDVKSQNIPIEIVYEDDDLLIVNKPKGMVVHPAAGNYDSTLVNALLYHCEGRLSTINGIIRPGIVHRIDKNTSGLLIVAKNDKSHLGLSEQIKAHSFYRAYETLVCGNIANDDGVIDAPIGRHPVDRKRMAVVYSNSKSAVTHYKVIDRYYKYTHLRLVLETGRTHQIRVHMSYIGHPVLGDDVYGRADKRLQGQCLHAKTIGFTHPVKGEYMEFTSELPDYFQKILEELSNA